MSIDRIEQIITKFGHNIGDELKDRWNAWEKDLTIPEKFEVLGGLMSRQVSISLNFIRCSSIWNGNIAPIILRTMVDNYINFAWIFEDPVNRAQKFIIYGLGQEKLQVEHRKNEMSNRAFVENEKLIVEAQEHWINSQRFTFLTEVSLQSLSGITTRKMAEEANCIDLYNYVYQTFSSATHNMWNHISKYNLLESDNPMHKYFRKPIVVMEKPDISYVELTAKYVNKMFMLFDQKTGYTSSKESSYQILLDDLDSFEQEVRNVSKNGDV